MRILVAGGAGYIGSATVEHLVEAGHQVWVVDNLSLGHRLAVHPGATFVQLDLQDTAGLTRLLEQTRCEAAMHFAAASLVGESMRQPERYFRNNVVGTLSLLEAALATGVRRFVFSSTAAVYGVPAALPITETTPIAPINPYGESKAMIERVLDWYDQIHGLRSARLRYFNAAGATDRFGEDHEPETHIIPILLRVAQGRQAKASIFGTDYETPDGTCIRDYVHVSDLAVAHELALQAIGERSLVANIGSSQGYSVREILAACRRVSGHPIPADEAPRRPGDPPRLVADATRLRTELGWQPRYAEIDAIVESAWRWHRANPHGYGDR